MTQFIIDGLADGRVRVVSIVIFMIPFSFAIIFNFFPVGSSMSLSWLNRLLVPPAAFEDLSHFSNASYADTSNSLFKDNVISASSG